ncbi:MAG: hypothetical protein A2086_13585 [Spirochaetes bacterium GWD1_27_9]|nr:MAG: hypothetical protein A2Z98_16430 [Spirochaetes bacterium GWB1_27_13]OHD27919.1 MAG: hypothetical protein A2Y34_14695 [Spirochaetes bacterium GWC1_27_15]OHD39286.1 MAG: hypothetical protein A2086_13585 [Spirochaetes bacterium GWD1_27_9]
MSLLRFYGNLKLGEGNIIKNHIFLLFIVINLLFINFYSFSKDVSSDKVILSEKEYLEKIKSNMSQTSTKDTKDKKTDKINLGRGYFEYIRIIIVLAIVVGVIYVVFLFLKKTLKIRDDIGEGANIIMSQSLGPGKWIQIVFVGGKYLILGVTNDSINLISEITDPKEIERLEITLNSKKSEEGDSFFDVISHFFKNTLKTKEPPKKNFDYEIDSVDFLKKQKDRIDKLKE